MIKRGEVWWVAFGKSEGGEVGKTRPAIVISNNTANTVLNRVIVVPLSSQTRTVYPGEALIAAGDKRAKAMADQLRTVGKQRLRRKMGEVHDADLKLVELAILEQLAIKPAP